MLRSRPPPCVVLSFLRIPVESAPAPTADCDLSAWTRCRSLPLAAPGEIKVSVTHGHLIGQDVRAVQPRQYTQRWLPVGDELSAVHHFEKRGDLGPGQKRRRIHVDPLVQGTEQRHGDAVRVELPGDAPAVHGNARMVLREIFVGASFLGGVAPARHDDEVTGALHAVDRRIPPSQRVEAQRLSSCDGNDVEFLGRSVVLRCHEYDPDEGQSDKDSWSDSHYVSISFGSSERVCRFAMWRRIQNRKRRPPAVCSPPGLMSSVPLPADGSSNAARL